MRRLSRITEHFTEHDLRAKAGSDAESLERARALLPHADSRTTAAIHRRKPVKGCEQDSGGLQVESVWNFKFYDTQRRL